MINLFEKTDYEKLAQDIELGLKTLRGGEVNELEGKTELDENQRVALIRLTWHSENQHLIDHDTSKNVVQKLRSWSGVPLSERLAIIQMAAEELEYEYEVVGNGGSQ